MTSLAIHLGSDARSALCEAFDSARYSIDAEYFSISDPDVVASLNRAAARGVRVRVVVEGDPHRFGVRRKREVEPGSNRSCEEHRGWTLAICSSGGSGEAGKAPNRATG